MNILLSRDITLPTKVHIVKGPYSFFSSLVQVWELNHKEGWAPKNWCFWMVMLEEIPERLLDSKEMKPVNLKGKQHRIFIGRTDAEVNALILWPHDVKSWLIRKDPDAGEDWRKVKSLSRVRLCDPVDCSLPGFSVHGILQARILEWVTITFSRGIFPTRDRTRSPALEADALTSEPP